MRSRIGLGLLGVVLATGVATAQTAPSTTTTPPTAASQSKTQSATTTGTGAFSSLSPGNQKIVQALCAAQKNGCDGTGSLTLDQIAAMKPKGEGWGEFFRQHQDLFPGAKNLGEAVSNFERSQKASSTASGSTSTTGKEKSEGAVSKGRDDQERSGPTASGGSSGSHGLGGGASGMGSSSGQLGGLGGRGGGRR